MAGIAVRLTRSRNAAGDLVVRLGVRLLDEYLEFLAGRCRPNTVLAVAYDLRVRLRYAVDIAAAVPEVGEVDLETYERLLEVTVEPPS